MTATTLEDKIVQALDSHQVCCLTTIEGCTPHERHMAMFNDGLQIYLATDRKSHSVEDLEENPNVHLVLGYTGSWDSEIVQIDAKSTVAKDESLRKKVWNDMMRRWFNGPDDPDYVLLEIEPSRIRLFDSSLNPEVWER
jgi:general stress protein 26